LDRKVLSAVLAAGASTRFGSAKQLANFGKQTLIEHVQTVLLNSTVDDVAVVLGCNLEAISQHILPEANVLVNEKWEEGIASSIRRAADFAKSQNFSHLFLLVCDQPFVSSCLVDKIVAISKFEPDKIIACQYGDTVGVPALFPSHFFDALFALQGDVGAKSVIKQADQVVLVDFPEGSIDIDTQVDIASADLDTSIP
jgi:molybdenum cofactor cytidylyltransferase